MLPGLGRTLIFLGILLVAVGVIFTLAPRLPWLGRLPGDIYVERKNFRFYFPLATSIVISIVLTLIFALLRFLRK
jgi:hypothetical protein